MALWTLPRALVTETLSPAQVRMAYPLMREVAPGLTLAVWMEYARRLPARGKSSRGVLAARRAGLPHLLGAVCYERGLDPTLGFVLKTEYFVALDLLHPQDVLLALVGGLDHVARDLGCGAVRAVVHQRFPGMADGLRDCGHEAEGVVMMRAVQLG